MNLPTISMSQEQYDLVMDAFGTEEEYCTWLKGQVVNFVISKKQSQEAEAFYSQQLASRQSLENTFE